MNTLNDEGFTALNHTLTRYLALIYNVRNWGSSFLPTTSQAKKGEHRPLGNPIHTRDSF